MSSPVSKTDSGSINILNVGTKVLRKDVMDQYIRTLGNYKTYYADSISWAIRTLSEKEIHVIITELDLKDGSAFRLCQAVEKINRNLYIVLVNDGDHPLQSSFSLAEEMGAQSVLVAPFNQENLKHEIELLERWREDQKEPWRIHLKDALNAIEGRVYTEVEKHFQAAIKAAPENPVPLCKAGIYYLGKPNYALAKTYLEKALEIKPDFIQAISALGLLHFTMGDLERAESLLMMAQSMSPLNPDRLIKIAQLHVSLSLRSCQESLRCDPENLDANLMIGKLLLLKKDYIRSIQELEKAALSTKDDTRNEAKGFIALARKLGGLKAD